jgi:uncharacterized membrane protein HdeD (DUF308 family)
MNLMLLGAISMACFTIGVFFIRFWKTTHDRFFLFFAGAFIVEGIERAMVGLIQYSDEQEPLFYLVRLLSFLMILCAIFDKNGLINRKIPE